MFIVKHVSTMSHIVGLSSGNTTCSGGVGGLFPHMWLKSMGIEEVGQSERGSAHISDTVANNYKCILRITEYS